MEPEAWPSAPGRALGCQVRILGFWGSRRGWEEKASYLTLVTAGAMGTLGPFPQGAIRGIAAWVITFLQRQRERP